MKKLLYYFLFLLPFLTIAQYDFDSRYFTITESSLPEAPNFDDSPQLLTSTKETSSTFLLDSTPTFEATLRSLRISSSNYWEPVDMMNALEPSKTYVNPNISFEPIKKDKKGFSVSVYASDGSTRVKNTVYKEVRGLNLMDPCPPIGICPRCAPYKMNRGY